MAPYVGDDFYCDVAIPRHEPIDVVHEDDAVLAFHHTRPFWPVHVVVVPKRHVPSLVTLEADDAATVARLLAVVQRVASDIAREHGAASVVTNVGAYQDSKHLHVHVRFGDPLERASDKLVRDRVPERIRAARGSVRTERLGDADYRSALLAKLREEAGEVAEASGRDALLEELADVLEVVRAIGAHAGLDGTEILERAEAKRASHGGFDARLRTTDYVAPPADESESAERPRRRAAAASPRQRREQ